MADKKTDTNTTLQDVKNQANDFRSKRGWNDEDPKDIALSLILEASELLEHFQFMSGEEVMKEARLFGPVCDELADVLWWVMVLADRFDIDMAQAFEKKLAKNNTKYPAELFQGKSSLKERTREYYKIKAKYRGSHPLAEED